MARAARRFASSVSCRFFSVASSVAATSVVGAVSPDLGVSSARRLAEAASRGVRSLIAPCKARPSASFWALRVCRSASVRFLSLSAVSMAVRPARVWSRSRGCASCAQARPSARRTKTRTAQCNRRNADEGFIAGKDGPEADSAARSSAIRPWPERGGNRDPAANSAFTLRRKKGCAPDAALLKGALTPMRAMW